MLKTPTIRATRLMALSFFFLVCIQASFGQSVQDTIASTSYKKTMIRVSIQNGNILKNNTPYLYSIDAEGNPVKATKAVSLEYGWQMLGGKEWHQTCKYPGMGIGLQYLHVVKRDDLGHPYSIYGFYDGVYFRTKKMALTNRMAAGLTYGLATYNPNDELPNDVIGSKINAFAELGVGIAAQLSDFLYVEPGFRFNHISNGNIRRPQKGINVVSYSIGMKYVFGETPNEPVKIPLNKSKHGHEVLAYMGMGTRQLEFGDDNNPLDHNTYGLNYLMANLHLGYNYGVTRRLKLGGGVDLIYDGTNGAKYAATSRIPQKGDVPFGDKIGLSVFLGGETAIDRLSVLTTLGYMVAQKRFEKSSPAFEQRLGFKYHFYKHVFAGANIRAYRFRAAKAIEFNIGVRKPLK